MKKLLSILFALISSAAFAQVGSLSQSVYRSRVNDSTTVNGATASGYGYFLWNNQKTVPSWQFWNGTSLVDWDPAAAGGGGAVSSVFSRTGAVIAASGDYTGTQVTNTPAGTIAATTTQAAINELDTEKAAINSQAFTGTPSLPTGTTGITQSAADNSTKLATTAYVDGAASSKVSTVTGDGVDNTDPINPVMDLSGYTPNITTFNSQSTDYTPVLSDGDGNTEIQITGTTPRTITIPTNASVPFPIGTIIYASRQGAAPGLITWDFAVGVTLITTKGNFTDPGQYVLMAAKKEGTNTWKVYNGLSFALSSSDVTSALGFTPVTNARTVAGIDLTANITITQLMDAIGAPKMRVLSSDQTNAEVVPNTLTNCGDLNFTVAANTKYWFRFQISYTSAAGTTGSKWSITGPTLTATTFRTRVSNSTTAESESAGLIAYDAGTVSTASPSTLGGIAIVEGDIECSASGTVQLRFSSEVTLSAIVAKAGRSFVRYGIIQEKP